MSSDGMLKAVFPLLEGVELAACMGVCKQWENIAKDDYLWKCLCLKKWPSTGKKKSCLSYRKIFKALYIREKKNRPTPLAPTISLSDVEFYIDIWGATDRKLLLSEVAPGPALRDGNCTPPPGIAPGMEDHLDGPEYKLTLPLKQQQLTISATQSVHVSVLISRNDSHKAVCIVNQLFDCNDCIDWSEERAVAYVQIAEFPHGCPFVNFSTSSINGEISLLFTNRDGQLHVFGIEINFLTAYSEDGVLWLLDMLQWH